MSKTNTVGREQALAEAVENERGRLLSFIRKQVRDPREAEDVLQDVFAEFVEAYDLGVAIETVGAWLVRVARNKVFDRFRKKAVQEEYRLLVQGSEAEAEDPNDPEAGRMREFLREEIMTALGALPAEQRDVFVMHELEGKSFEDIAAATGVGMNTLLARKRYAVLALRNHLKEVYDEL